MFYGNTPYFLMVDRIMGKLVIIVDYIFRSTLLLRNAGETSHFSEIAWESSFTLKSWDLVISSLLKFRNFVQRKVKQELSEMVRKALGKFNSSFIWERVQWYLQLGNDKAWSRQEVTPLSRMKNSVTFSHPSQQRAS